MYTSSHLSHHLPDDKGHWINNDYRSIWRDLMGFTLYNSYIPEQLNYSDTSYDSCPPDFHNHDICNIG